MSDKLEDVSNIPAASNLEEMPLKEEDHSDVLAADINDDKVKALEKYYDYALKKQKMRSLKLIVISIISNISNWVYIIVMQLR